MTMSEDSIMAIEVGAVMDINTGREIGTPRLQYVPKITTVFGEDSNGKGGTGGSYENSKVPTKFYN